MMGAPDIHGIAVPRDVSNRTTGHPRSQAALRARTLAVLSIITGFAASPALADQSVLAADNGTVGCVASAKDLTRISLTGDQFTSVSKISTGNADDDFKIVNEPTRGDCPPSAPMAQI